MAKCNQLTPVPFKGLSVYVIYWYGYYCLWSNFLQYLCCPKVLLACCQVIGLFECTDVHCNDLLQWISLCMWTLTSWLLLHYITVVYDTRSKCETSSSWAVNLSWKVAQHLQILVIRLFYSEWPVGQTGLWSGFISKSVPVRFQVSLCSCYDLCLPG